MRLLLLLCKLSEKLQSPALPVLVFPQLAGSKVFIFMDGPTCGKWMPCLHTATVRSDTEIIRSFSKL